MIAIRGLACVAVLGAANVAFAPRMAADPGREGFTVAFRYDETKTPLDNYLAFARQAERACSGRGVRPLDQRARDRACAEALIAQMVSAMGRDDLANIHAIRIKRPNDSSRTFAVR